MDETILLVWRKAFTKNAFGTLIFVLLMSLCGLSYAETRRVTAEGESEECLSRKKGRKVAEKETINDAREECAKLGPDWEYAGVIFSGYEQYKRCGKTETFTFTIKQAIHKCTDNLETSTSMSPKTLTAMSAKLDKVEFDEELGIIETCTKKRDFACAEEHIEKAGSLANSNIDNKLLSAARSKLSKLKSGKTEEVRRRIEPNSGASRSSKTGASNPVAITTKASCNDSAIIGTWNCRTGNGDTQTVTYSDGGIMTSEYKGMGGPCSANGSYNACGGVMKMTNVTNSCGTSSSSFEFKYSFDNSWLYLPGTYGSFSCSK
jgi:hypothetical protein